MFLKNDTEPLQIGDRVIPLMPEQNPLTDYYITNLMGDIAICDFSFRIFTGTVRFLTPLIYKHPIQKPSLVYEIEFNGNEIPYSNKYQDYFSKFSTTDDFLNLYTEGIKCFKNTYKKEKIDINTTFEKLISCLKHNDPLSQIDGWIMGTIERFPSDFQNTYRLEYNLSEGKVFINSDKYLLLPGCLFLLCFASLILMLNITTPTNFLKFLDSLAERE